MPLTEKSRSRIRGALAGYCDSAGGLAAITVTAGAAQVVAEIAKEEDTTAASTFSVLLHLLQATAPQVFEYLLLF